VNVGHVYPAPGTLWVDMNTILAPRVTVNTSKSDMPALSQNLTFPQLKELSQGCYGTRYLTTAFLRTAFQALSSVR
jgi:hypothetical protein